MRGFGILMCIIGSLIAAGGIIAYFSDSEGFGIAGMVVGACFLGIGVMMFMTDFILRLARRSAKLTIHFEMGSPESEERWFEEGVGEPQLRRWAE